MPKKEGPWALASGHIHRTRNPALPCVLHILQLDGGNEQVQNAGHC